MSVQAVAVQPFASVMDTQYEPAARPLIEDNVEPLDQMNKNGAVPPPTFAVAEPEPGAQSGLLASTVTVTGGVDVTSKQAVAVQPARLVTVTQYSPEQRLLWFLAVEPLDQR